MAVRPVLRETLRAVAGLVRGAVASAVAGRPMEEIVASAVVRAPNFGRLPPAPAAGEWLVPVGPPSALLSVAIVEPPTACATVFVLHGIRDSKATMGGWAAMLIAQAYRAVLVDSRGHGRSTGRVLTYGVQEALDLMLVLDALVARGSALGPVGVMGHSYGAATALQWAGRDPRVRAVVAVSPFATFRTVVPGYLPWALSPTFAGRVVDAAGALAGFDPDAASPVDAVARTPAALLLVHGRDDARIPTAHSERIAAAAAGPVELVRVDGANHDTVAGAPQTRLAERAAAWFRAHLVEARPAGE
jgi:pimeloyl-ACP methyl ester carboxylesterase